MFSRDDDHVNPVDFLVGCSCELSPLMEISLQKCHLSGLACGSEVTASEEHKRYGAAVLNPFGTVMVAVTAGPTTDTSSHLCFSSSKRGFRTLRTTQCLLRTQLGHRQHVSNAPWAS